MRHGGLRDLVCGTRSSEGVALIMVLWVIAILSVVALEFCFAMRTEIHITNNYKDDLQLYAMAEGGVQRTILELIYKHDPGVQQVRKTQKSEEVPADKKEWVADGRPYLIPFEQGTCEIKVVSEAGKVNINIVSESMLRKIIEPLGLEEEARDIVVDSILDWRDPNDFHRVNGAEDEYYQSLKEPYHCKNGNLDSVEELLLVRGVTPDLFYGRNGLKKEEGEKKVDRIGLQDLFSIYSTGEQVDINSATPVVLKVVLGIPVEVSQQMVKAREEKLFENLQDLVLRVPEISPFIKDIGKYLLFRSLVAYYTIESRARFQERGSIRSLRAIVKVDPKEKEGYKILQWTDSLVES
jgi:general secretion pathway protein K